MKILKLQGSGLESIFTDFPMMPFHLHTDKRDMSHRKTALPWIHRWLGSAVTALYLVRRAWSLCRKKWELSAQFTHLPVFLRCSEVHMSFGICQLCQIMCDTCQAFAQLTFASNTVQFLSFQRPLLFYFFSLPSACPVPFVCLHLPSLFHTCNIYFHLKWCTFFPNL